MNTKHLLSVILLLSVVFFISCKSTTNEEISEDGQTEEVLIKELTIQEKVAEYSSVKLDADISKLSEKEKQMIKHLIKASEIIDEIYWDQTFGNKEDLFNSIGDEDTLKYIKINYGPWDRLNGNKTIIEKYGKKPIGANYYPSDVKYLPFISMKFEDKLSQFTLLRRNANGEMYTIPYHKAYNEQLSKAAELLNQAAELSENENFKKYLKLRAEALLSDNYYDSDIAWMDMSDNNIDFIIGAIECTEDRFINTKNSYEAFILLKDNDWSKIFMEYANSVPKLISNIPVEDKYKKNIVGSASDIGVYDAIYYAGLCNTGGKSISINLPKDGRIIMEKGNKNLIFKNATQAKFDKILKPIASTVIDDSQLENVKFEAFLENNLFYEIVDGLNVIKTIDDNGFIVKDVLKEHYNTINGLKANIIRMQFITELHDLGLHNDKELLDNYVTFVADIFRSVRFGLSEVQAEFNMITFNHFIENGAISRNETNGKYIIDLEKMKKSLASLTQTSLVILGNGDYNAAKELIKEMGFVNENLRNDLTKISEAGIPRDIVFEQGAEILEL